MRGAVRLIRAAENLLDNAVRYTPRGGTVTLLVTKEKQDFILRVTDTGPGFTAESLARAGELLYTEAARSDTAHQALGCILHAGSRFHTVARCACPTPPAAAPSFACQFVNKLRNYKKMTKHS